ncbi:MAG: methyltransferase domain-containing protein [Alphaproteobacteria bacterium]
MTGAMEIFDRRLLRRRRERAAATLGEHDFLLREAALRLVDRLADVQRAFPLALDLGCHTGILGTLLAGSSKISTLVQTDIALAMARRAGSWAVVADEEALPFADGSFHLILSCLGLHTVNDLPGALAQIRRALKPDGLFLATLFGGETLGELRQAWLEAELGQEGGVSPRVSPFADLSDAAGLLQRAGFALPVADADRITVSYDDPMRLMIDLRAMGESNVLLERRRRPTRRATMAAVAERYMANFSGTDGRVPATFHLIHLTGWAPHPSQQQPLAPGSASKRLASALGTEELSAGDKAVPRRRMHRPGSR